MSEDYASAARRHHEDAEFLEGDGRIDNADQLYGISAKCALKFALASVGAFNDGHRTHIDTLMRRIQWTHFHRAFSGLARLSVLSHSFDDWCISQRYRADGAVSLATLDSHRTMTKRITHAAGLTRG